MLSRCAINPPVVNRGLYLFCNFTQDSPEINRDPFKKREREREREREKGGRERRERKEKFIFIPVNFIKVARTV